MGIELPAELADVAAKAGVQWPQADEDAMRDSARAWRDAGTKVTSLAGQADGTANKALDTLQGSTGDAAKQHWNGFVAPDSGHFTATAKGCTDSADRLEHAADQVGAAKVQIVQHLVNLAKNTNVAEQAASAGHPTALLQLDTLVRGTAANVAHVTNTLAGAVHQDSGVTVAGSPPPAQANPGAHGPGLLGSLTHSVSTLTTHDPGLPQSAPAHSDGLLSGVTNAVTGGGGQHGGGVLGGVTDAVTGSQSGHGSGLLGGVTGDQGAHGGGHDGGLLGGVTNAVTGGGGQHGGGVLGGVTDAVTGGGQSGHGGGLLGGVTDAVTGGHGGHDGGLLGGVDNAVHGVTDTAAGAVGGLTGHPGHPGDAGAGAVGGTPGGIAHGGIGAVGDTVNQVLPPSHDQGGGDIGRLLDPGQTGPVPAHHGGFAEAPTPPAGSTVQQSVGAGVLDPPSAVHNPVGPSPIAQPIASQQPPDPGPGQGAAPQAPTGAPIGGGAPVSGGSAAGGPVAGPAGGAPSGGGVGGSVVPGPRAGGSSARYPGNNIGALADPGAVDRTPLRPGVVSGARVDAVPVDAGRPVVAPAQRQPPPHQQSVVALFLVHMFPIGHMPVPASRPARQLPPPPVEIDYAAGMRFAPHDHPDSRFVDDADALAEVRAGRRAAELPAGRGAEDVQALTDGYDPLGGEHERDWDRRFLVRPAEEGRSAEYAWPPGELFPEGGCDDGEPVVLAPDVVLDRFGIPEGRVFSEDGTLFARRSLTEDHLAAGYHRYRVLRPLPVWRTLVAPWFGQPGGGPRLRTTYSAAELVTLGYLIDVTEEKADER